MKNRVWVPRRFHLPPLVFISNGADFDSAGEEFNSNGAGFNSDGLEDAKHRLGSPEARPCFDRTKAVLRVNQSRGFFDMLFQKLISKEQFVTA
ncbi:MAG: hypothetical protein RR608_04335 [Bacteroidales bacterium]